MRGLLLGLVVFGAVQSEPAADLSALPVLRGALTDGTAKSNWQGFTSAHKRVLASPTWISPDRPTISQPGCFPTWHRTDKPDLVMAAVGQDLIHGYTAGLGVDVQLLAGEFMRAQWEYIRFTAAVDTSVNTVRAGLGYKF